jgi:hypothetical protein
MVEKMIPLRWWKFALMPPPSLAPVIHKQIVEFATYGMYMAFMCLVGASMASQSTFSKDSEILPLPEGSQSHAVCVPGPPEPTVCSMRQDAG